MVEILDLEEAWALVRKLYGRKEEGWSCLVGITESKLLSFLLKGPDADIKIVQDNPLTFLSEEMSQIPEPWKPVGRGVVLDEDLTKIPTASQPYGLRPISKKTFENMMYVAQMIERGRPEGEIAYHMDTIIREHIQQPVASYDQLRGGQPASIGPYGFAPRPFDISPAQRELESRLDAEVRGLQRKRHPYVI